MAGILSALGVFNPDQIETRLFQIGLNESSLAISDLQSWERSGNPDFLKYLAASGKWMRGQLPMIYANLSEQLIDTPLRCRPHLKTATLRERLRYDMYGTCLKDALAALNDVGLPFCVVKGVAAANTVYAQPFLRHCHDLDIVVHSEDRSDFEQACVDRGFRRIGPQSHLEASSRLDHALGLPVMLHCLPVAGDLRLDAAWIMDGRLCLDTPAGKMPVPRPARRILHAWLHRFSTDRFERNAWVPDTVLDLRRCGLNDIEEMNSLLAQYRYLAEAHASSGYLATNFDGLSLLAELRWTKQTRRGLTTEPQRMRFLKRANAQNSATAFKERLDFTTRAYFLYDKILPSAEHFGLASKNTTARLWRQRIRRLLSASLRRLKRVVSI